MNRQRRVNSRDDRRWGAGALEQFEAFYARTAPALHSYICRISANPSLAEDILQGAYIRLLQAPAMEKSQRRAYLYKIATNLITDSWRRQKREQRWWQFNRHNEAVRENPELAQDVERLFEKLNIQERALLWLAYVEGADRREIAAVLGLRENSVRVLLMRARRKIEYILRRYGYQS